MGAGSAPTTPRPTSPSPAARVPRSPRTISSELLACILLVCNGLQPVGSAVGRGSDVDGHVDHISFGGGAMPVLLVRREVDDAPGFDLYGRLALSRSTAGARDHVEYLTLRMGVPVRTAPGSNRTRLTATSGEAPTGAASLHTVPVNQSSGPGPVCISCAVTTFIGSSLRLVSGFRYQVTGLSWCLTPEA